MSNMDIWDKVCKTNPDDTKEVSFGRKFTAIDAQKQIKAATALFGPVGIGWGWTAEPSYPGNGTVAMKVTLWHGSRDNVCGPQFGGCDLFLKGQAKKADADALKKATTDGVTKGLALLGFNSDVFEGKFDDNKYVQEQTQKHEAKKNEVPKTKLEQQALGFHRDIDAVEDVAQLQSLWQSEGFRFWYNDVAKRFPEWHKEKNSMDAHKEKRKSQLQDTDASPFEDKHDNYGDRS